MSPAGAFMVAVLAGALVVPASGRPVATTGAELEVPRDAATTIAGPVFAVGFPRSTGLVAVGDVNRDGKRDLLVTNTQGHAGDQVRGNVLFGGSWPTSIRLPARGTRGFPLSGIAAASGDVNRDGYDDLVSCAMVRTSARVLFGRPGRRPPGDRGFRITGSSGCPQGIGDVDGDGFDDLVADGARAGAVTIVLGRRSAAAVDLTRSDPRLVRLEARQPVLLVPVGDVNGDRRADLVVDPGYRSSRALVLFGRRQFGRIDLDRARLPAIGGLGSQRAVASAGDVNGDGLGDLVIGQPVGAGGHACVVLGRRGRWPATTTCTGARGVIVRGAPPNAGLGGSVGSAGDLDRDGFGDLWVGAPSERIAGSDFGGGAVYIVYGRKGARRIDVAGDPRVVRIAAAPDLGESLGVVTSGGSVAAVGDLTGDGRADIVLGGDLRGRAWVMPLPAP